MARHPATTDLLQWFGYDHLPEHLQPISQIVATTATEVVNAIPIDSPELSAGLRKLLEAKDCFVRADIVAKRT